MRHLTTTFFAPPSHVKGERLTLPNDEALHALRVLRHRVGDVVHVVDGEGGWYSVRLDVITAQSALGTILETRRDVGEPAFDLTLAFGLVKSQSRLETFVEKAVELGVNRLIPLETARTERTRLRTDRLERIVVAAMKQCGRSKLIEVSPSMTFERFVAHSQAGAKLLCHELSNHNNSLAAALDEIDHERLTIAIGPEGGFTEAEVEAANGAGFRIVHLGNRRLRAETAGIAAATAVMLRWSASR